ncbi:hypothetical protein A2814_00195 [Candidatus Nomurabacteria bacterium RIFCSPHIGHO2_01_FULL_38_19]|uniref:Uncharacterized protein n=1 Tax=Candidatus Nomurabacteria bacterium RIFCSPHIGHO2_01_FULL_38_19 TaxID=1801732 RepID=A0A1F6UQZ0_9BACT|nr:MAG: hypothetical protein A2814_00195 [Candidatus Nomurabacteria bacterium RIFCSPHIGHO2_01_FULL_38_19]
MKKSILILVIFTLVILINFKVYNQRESQKRHAEFDPIILKAMEFYSPYEIKNLSIDSYFLFKEITKHRNEQDISYHENIYENNPFIRLLDREKNVIFINFSELKGYSYKINPEYQLSAMDPWDTVLLKALYCDMTEYDDEDFSALELLSNHKGNYWDTHFLIGLLFLKNNGCYISSEIQKSIGEVTSYIIDAQKNDTSFSDLYAERIVVLYWAGYGESVKKEWIERVKDNFTNDLGWRANYLSVFSNPHTTGLSILSLIYYLEAKPKQPFY